MLSGADGKWSAASDWLTLPETTEFTRRGVCIVMGCSVRYGRIEQMVEWREESVDRLAISIRQPIIREIGEETAKRVPAVTHLSIVETVVSYRRSRRTGLSLEYEF